MKIFKRIMIVLLSLIGLIVLVVAGYIIYMEAVYYRIEDNQVLEVQNNQSELVKKNQEYSISSYNVGFGAYSQDYSFFMDTGVLDGVETHGKYSRGRSKEEVLENINGSIDILKELNTDFMLLQEVDIKAHRSYFLNQKDLIEEAFNSYTSTFAYNYHAPYLAYPIPPHGAVDAGILTLGRYKMDSSLRRSLPITDHWVNKMFDLDRCYSMNHFKLDGSDKELVLINIHMSAYDKEGFRDKQLKMLNEELASQKALGNYVIVGGDFNHDVSNSIEAFKTVQERRTDLPTITNNDLTSGFKWADAKNNAPTVRNCNIGYIRDYTYTYVCDGFIVSDNIEIKEIKNIDKAFMYADHNPVYLKFLLK